MKQKIFARLKTMYTNIGLSDAFLMALASTLAISVTEETQIDAACTAAKESITEAQKIEDRHRGEVNTLINKVKTLEEAPGTEPDDETDPADDPPKGGDVKPKPKQRKPKEDSETAVLLKTMMAKLEALEGDKRKTLNSKTLIDGLTAKGVPDWYYEEAIDGRDFKDEAEVNAFVEKLSTKWAVVSKNNKNLSAQVAPKPANGQANNAGDEEVSSAMQERLATMKKEKEAKSKQPV